ncbi:MAG: fibronectin type III domain-containing protein [Deltaproteobacteria bacterium]|nr:fibronectin type III domain-containing protein [Deltaproteobacteria bacterium]
MKIGALFVALALAAGQAGLARARTLEAITIEEPTQKFNIESCKSETFSFKVIFRNSSEVRFVAAAPYELWIARGSGCTAEENDPDSIAEVSCKENAESCCAQLNQGVVNVSLAATGEEKAEVTQGPFEIVDFFDCDQQKEGSFELIVYSQPGQKYTSVSMIWEESSEWKKQTESVEYDFVRPEPPQITSVDAGESSMEVHWTPLEDQTIRYRAYATTSAIDTGRSIADQQSGLTDLQHSKESAEGASSATIYNLRATTEYQVVVVSIDDQDNESFPSTPQTKPTVEVVDFYEYYRQIGGSEDGGYCALAPPGSGRADGLLALLLAALALLATRRRRRQPAAPPSPGSDRSFHRCGLLAASLLVFLLASGPPRPASAESPRVLTFSFSLGTYQPMIDDEFHSSTGTGPYRRFFGDDGAFLSRLDLGWNLITSAGTLSAGLGFAFGSVTAEAYEAGSSRRSHEETTLRLLPLSLSLTYALDLFAQRFSFPLVPFASAGADYMLWWVYDGKDEVSTTEGPKGEGKGGIPGYHASLGVRLLLDVFAPDMATSFDHDMGVNNSYIFLEYLMTRIDGYADKSSMNLSANTLFFGIAFDF